MWERGGRRKCGKGKGKADICVVVVGFAAVVYYLFFYEKLESKSKDTGAPKEEQA